MDWRERRSLTFFVNGGIDSVAVVAVDGRLRVRGREAERDVEALVEREIARLTDR